MLYSGIAWTPDGYTVDVIGEDGEPAVPARSFGGSEVSGIIGHLRGIEQERGEPVATVVDSTNGVLDGYLLVAGLDVYRADPNMMAERSGFGSVPAVQLAELARSHRKVLTKLSVKDGTLYGRVQELDAGWYPALPVMADLAEQGRCISHGPRERNEVALTFDDGPNPVYTPQVLEILGRYDIRATFFCIGLSTMDKDKDIARIADLGHYVGNHTWSHPFLPDITAAELREQVERTNEALARVTGQAPSYVRPPYGALNKRILNWWSAIPDTIAMWDVGADDWAAPEADVIAKRVLDQTQPGSVILLHDGGGDRSNTVAALPAIIEGLLERGLSFTTFPDLVRA
jgi:peptidoglycan-N-acetylglucosamine deacetylase